MKTKDFKFKTGADVNGTSLQGYINITFDDLEKVLGDAEKGDGDKVQAEWCIEGEVDGEKVVATIYDWKNYGLDVSKVIDWHIGGRNEKGVELIRRIFGNKYYIRLM